MITRFDHAVIAVRDLEAASRQFARLGFDTQPGGRHTGRGTENAIIRFGLDYIELISVYDADEARASGWGGGALVAYLAEHQGGLIGFCLATDSLDEHVEGLKRALPDTLGPLDMQRQRPDGEILRWRLLIPGGSPWLSSYPFLIEWQLPDAARLSLETPGRHEVGAIRVEALSVSAPEQDLGAVLQTYSDVLGLEGDRSTGTFPIGDFMLHVGVAGATGPVELVLAVDDMNAAGSRLAARGVRVRRVDKGLRIDPAEALGAAITLTA